MKSIICLGLLLVGCGLAAGHFTQHCKNLVAEGDQTGNSEQDVVECANGLLNSTVIWHYGMNEKAQWLYTTIERATRYSMSDVCWSTRRPVYQTVECMRPRIVQNVKAARDLGEVARACSKFKAASRAPKYMLAVLKELDNSDILDQVLENATINNPMTIYRFCSYLEASS